MDASCSPDHGAAGPADRGRGPPPSDGLCSPPLHTSQVSSISNPDDISSPASFALALTRLEGRVRALRPGPQEPPCARIEALTDQLDADEALREQVSRELHEVLDRVDAVDTLTTVGILGGKGLLAELGQRLSERVLPSGAPPGSLHQVLRVLFPHAGDAEWLAQVSPGCWERLQDALDLRVDPDTAIPPALATCLRVLAHRIASLGLEPVLTSRVPELAPGQEHGSMESPFLVLSDQVLTYVRSHGNGLPGDELPALQACRATLQRCRGTVNRLRANKHMHGTSLELTALSARMLDLCERLDLLLALTDPVEPQRGQDVARVVVDLVRSEQQQQQIGRLIRQHADLLVFQVVEHAARKGRTYITRTRPEYLRFLVSSMGGGLIVGLFALFKVKLGGLDLSLAVEALLYSLNYALCFVAIYLTGATLATKQPAVTAHSLAASLDGPGDSHHLGQMAVMIARASRSQFISFVGNVIVAFPLGLLLAVGWQWVTGQPLADPAKAASLVDTLHPWLSPSLLYAGVAGVFLFSAGLVSGWVDNHLLFARIPTRIARNALLHRLVGSAGAQRLAELTDAKAGALVGNVVLGFCLGGAGILGQILGLPFDIRHIAFSSAHLAMGFDGLGWTLPLRETLTVALGVALIGLVNFLVSFGLALALALESRQVTFGELRRLLGLVGRRLLTHPSDFFWAPREERQ